MQQIIGVDCATQSSSVGLARGRKGASGWALEEVCTGTNRLSPAEIVAAWILERSEPTLLALDAPLGWPVELGRALVTHTAGAAINPPANLLFRRETDRVVREVTGKQSLDVGADRIARTAHWALGFLAKVRELTGSSVPLAWRPEITVGVEAIEVYPAVTLIGHGLEIDGYKNLSNVARRKAVVAELALSLQITPHEEVLIAGGDILDAAVCVMAGLDFLAGNVVEPADHRAAEVEGWIWFRAPGE